MEEYDLVILTTAVTRPDLHSKVFPAMIDTLDGLHCKWIINIDEINGQNVEDTASNFKEIFAESDIDLEFLYTNEIGGKGQSFFNSVTNLMTHGVKYKPKIGFYWLEDDWQIIQNHKIKSLFDDIDFTSENWYITLANRDQLNFNPSIWSNDVFFNIGYKRIISVHPSTHNLNPERTCCYTGSDWAATRKNLNNFYVFNYFKDVGRSWQKEFTKGERTFRLM